MRNKIFTILIGLLLIPTLIMGATQYSRWLLTNDAGTSVEMMRLTNENDGTLWLGSGQAVDTNLYRSAANTLKTDDGLSVGGDTTLTGDITVNGGMNTFNDSGNQDVVTIANDGTGRGLAVNGNSTGHGIRSTQVGVLAANRYALAVYSNTAQVNSPLVKFTQDNASSTEDVLNIVNDGTGTLLEGLAEVSVSAAGKPMVKFYSYPNMTNSDSALMKLHMDGNGSTEPTLEIINDGSGNTIETNSGGGTPAHLTSSGVWTDASSMYADKMNISEIDYTGFVDKLRTLKLFKYQKKWEVYGGMEHELSPDGVNLTKKEKEKFKEGSLIEKGGKKYRRRGEKRYEIKDTRNYRRKVVRPNAPYHMSHILDDPTTPEDLISRDIDTNEMTGPQAQKGIAFLLAVCKEQQTIIDDLVERISILEGIR